MTINYNLVNHRSGFSCIKGKFFKICPANHQCELINGKLSFWAVTILVIWSLRSRQPVSVSPLWTKLAQYRILFVLAPALTHLMFFKSRTHPVRLSVLQHEMNKMPDEGPWWPTPRVYCGYLKWMMYLLEIQAFYLMWCYKFVFLCPRGL